MQTLLPFNDIRQLLKNLPNSNDAQAKKTLASLTDFDLGSYGQLGEIIKWYASWSQKPIKPIEKAMVTVFAATHGLAANSDSAWYNPNAIPMAAKIIDGNGVVNRLSKSLGLGFRLFDLALNVPTGDIMSVDAFDEKGCAATIAYGMEATAGGIELLAIDSMGAGDKVTALTLMSAVFEIDPDELIKDKAICDAILRAHRVHASYETDPLEMLRRYGGRETAAICGAILAARIEGIPVVVSGYSALAAMAVLWKLKTDAIDHVWLADWADKPVFEHVAKLMNLRVKLHNMSVADGQGCGAAMGAGQIMAAMSLTGQ